MKAVRWLMLDGWSPNTVFVDGVVTLVRVAVGVALALGHGWGKVNHPDAIIGISDSLGMPFPTITGWAAALAEFAGGLLLALGLLTRPAAFFILVTMSFAIYAHAVTWGDPFKANPMEGQNGWELALLYWLFALQFVVLGSGRFGMDRLIR